VADSEHQATRAPVSAAVPVREASRGLLPWGVILPAEVPVLSWAGHLAGHMGLLEEEADSMEEEADTAVVVLAADTDKAFKLLRHLRAHFLAKFLPKLSPTFAHYI
jgi:hypothetical protein